MDKLYKKKYSILKGGVEPQDELNEPENDIIEFYEEIYDDESEQENDSDDESEQENDSDDESEQENDSDDESEEENESDVELEEQQEDGPNIQESDDESDEDQDDEEDDEQDDDEEDDEQDDEEDEDNNYIINKDNIVENFSWVDSLKIIVEDDVVHELNGIYKKVIDKYYIFDKLTQQEIEELENDFLNNKPDSCVYIDYGDNMNNFDIDIKEKNCKEGFNNFINKNKGQQAGFLGQLNDKFEYLIDIGFIYYNSDKCMIMFKFDEMVFFINAKNYNDDSKFDQIDYYMECNFVQGRYPGQNNFMLYNTVTSENDDEVNIYVDIDPNEG